MQKMSFWNKQNKLILYHGSPIKEFTPEFGKGKEKHDYGKGFYLTEDLALAQEWSVCDPTPNIGWVHKYELDCTNLKIFDFQNAGILAWLAELMKHRAASNSKRYRMLAQKFINKYGVDVSNYDVIKGWRADASYFYIAKEFVRDNIDVDILEELLTLGGLGIQYCLKSELAFSKLSEIKDDLISVDYSKYNALYDKRDTAARNKMRELIDSDRNEVTKVFSTLI